MASAGGFGAAVVFAAAIAGTAWGVTTVAGNPADPTTPDSCSFGRTWVEVGPWSDREHSGAAGVVAPGPMSPMLTACVDPDVLVPGPKHRPTDSRG